MGHAVDLRKIMAFILVDKKDVPRLEIIEPVVDQKLLSAGDGIVNLVAVVDVDIHGFLVIIQMGRCKGLRIKTGLDGGFTGILDDHGCTSAVRLLCGRRQAKIRAVCARARPHRDMQLRGESALLGPGYTDIIK